MRSIFPPLLLTVLLTGCAAFGPRTGSMTAYDGVSADYPGDAQALADAAAEEMAHRYPPGRTTLALAETDTTFGLDLESALRQRGFSIAAPDAAGIQVAYTLDVIRDETPPACYLRVRTSDNTAFGTLRVLTGEPRKIREKPADMPSAMAQTTPASHPLNDPPSAVKPTTQPASTHVSGLKPAPVQGAAASPKVQLPSPRPVLPAKLERPGPPPQRRHKRSSATAARVASPAARHTRDTIAARPTTNSPANVPRSQPTSSSAIAPAAVHSGPGPAMPPMASPEKKLQPRQLTPVTTTVTPPLTPPAPTPLWNIAPGSLHTQLENWAMRAHYQLIWKAHHDFELESKAGFDGDFISAIKKLFAGLDRDGHALRVTVYTVNNVIEIAED